MGSERNSLRGKERKKGRGEEKNRVGEWIF